ncbi:MAG: hypothetical protein AUJ47_10385 [Candidatus Marinimicrobia bacterium CG1_02_48_14]|nr:MAG: hypothetical protein AUJ47_10385 [Candidatus Marinimicrobia bacterium CG1_02_48_14]
MSPSAKPREVFDGAQDSPRETFPVRFYHFFIDGMIDPCESVSSVVSVFYGFVLALVLDFLLLLFLLSLTLKTPLLFIFIFVIIFFAF